MLLGLIVLQLYLIGVDYFFREKPEFSAQTPFYEIDNYYSNHLTHVWTKGDIYSFYGSKGGVNLEILDDNIFFIGGFEEKSIYDLKLISLDSSSGNILWQVPKNRPLLWLQRQPTGLAANENNVFLNWDSTQKISGDTKIGAAKVIAYNSLGEQIWSQSIGGARSITTMIVNKNTVSVDGSFSSNYYLLDSNTGKEVNSIAKEIDNHIWFKDPQTLYRYSHIENSLEAVNQTSGDILWRYSISDPIYLAPKLANDTIVIRTNENRLVGRILAGRILAINKTTGNLIWEASDALSNVAITDSVVHYLTNDLLLRSININSGEIVGKTDFTPSKAVDPTHNVHQIATNGRMMFIYFGGEHQLSAFTFDNSQN